MNIFSWKSNKLKLFGITLFKIKQRKKRIYFYLLEIPIYWYGKEAATLLHEVNIHTDFDMSELDKKIDDYVSKYITPQLDLNDIQSDLDNNKIAFLATELYDTGGHSKCIKDLIKSLSGIYEQKLFLTQKSNTFKRAPSIIASLQKLTAIDGVDGIALDIQKILKSIISYSPKALLVYIHPNDAFGAAILSALEKTTKIKIIFFNHGSHHPVVGMRFAKVILEGMPTTQKITNQKRGIQNTEIIGLQSLSKEETTYFSQDELYALKQSLGIAKHNLVTISGGFGHKFFDGHQSPYFEMIKSLLTKEPNLIHIVISRFKKKQKQIIREIFKNSDDTKKRLIILPYQQDFDKYFQCADVFIDSFPIASALTQIDLMRNKVASVVKINNENPEYSFHEYQMPDYPYMFNTVEDMEKGILTLLHNREKRQEIISANYDFWLKTYESSVVRDKYINIIEEN